MKFSEMPYARPDLNELKQQLQALTDRLKAAPDYAAAREAFLAQQKLSMHIDTLATLSSVRNSIDTRDKFYDAEEEFWNEAGPELRAYDDAWTAAMLESPFRKEFAAEYGELMFLNAEIARKAFSPAIVEELKQENQLVQDYQKLIASAQIEFEGNTYTISQLSPFKNDPDDARRLAAWQAEGGWYKAHQTELDEIYDKLVKLRDAMGRKLGYDGYTQMGYYRMGRNCYTKQDVEEFRAAVVKYVVPVAASVYEAQAKRLGKTYPMTFADNALSFRSGNPKPCGTPDDILAQGKRFYEALSPETGEFFNTMLDNELLDVLSTPGKRAGGYCTSLGEYRVPFIFANFNGTSGDVDVITHECGHAFQGYLAAQDPIREHADIGMETAEIHSMSMEFFTEKWMNLFFGDRAQDYVEMHLEDAAAFIPYGCMVDEFQHIVYEHPELTPAERKQAWSRLEREYKPHLDYEGDPFFGQGGFWQKQLHIYDYPLYYIDYCLAQTCALQYKVKMDADFTEAWKSYLKLCRLSASDFYTNMIKKVGLDSPFEPGCVKNIVEKLEKYVK